PRQGYSARVRWISDNPNFDFAVLEINADDGGNSIDQSTLHLAYMGRWNGSAEIMDQVYFFTYQATGDNYLVITPGTITTTPLVPIEGQLRAVYQSNATFASGGSGGLVVNRNGEFVGLPWEFQS